MIDQEIFFQESLATINDVLNSSFIINAVQYVDGSIQRQKDSDDEDATEISEELSRYLTSFFEHDLNDAFAEFIVSKNLEKALQVVSRIIEPNNVELRFKAFFKSLSITDMHGDIATLNRNKKLKEELELYLYFGQIKASNRTYPLFFIPLSLTEKVNQNKTAYKLSFEKRFYVNKNAIEYIFEKDAESNTAAQISSIIGDRIVYIDENKSLASELSKKVGDLVSQFGMSGNVDFMTSTNNTASSSSVSINNKLTLALFDKADESSINDYEELLHILDEDNPLSNTFKKLINNFIEQEPTSIIREVISDWDKTPTEEKLVFSSPIPLNEEQRKILSAVNNKTSKFITVQGPPGTGKSHTITAILFEAILKDKSVLMLSDKKEALDVVEDKLSEVLNKTRTGDGFQNPILRLGREGNTYTKILAAQNIENIRVHLRASEQTLKENNPSKIKEDLTTKTKEYIDKYSEIDTADIKRYLDYKNTYSLSDEDEKSYVESIDMIIQYKESIECITQLSEKEEIISFIENNNLKTTDKLYLSLRAQVISETVIKKYGSISFLNTFNVDNVFLKEKTNEYNEVNQKFFSFLFGKFQLKTWNAELNSKLDRSLPTLSR